MIFSQDNLKQVRDFIESAKSILIIGHRSPDGDAVGSTLALQHYLQSLNKKSDVLMPDGFPPFLKWLPGSEGIHFYDGDSEAGQERLKTADLIFCLDFNRMDRVGPMSKHLIDASCPKVVIDHHLDPSTAFDQMFSETTASSTCELVYRLVEALGDTESQTKEFFTCIYTGLLTDTGSFKYNVYPTTFRIAGHIVSKGIVPQDVQSSLFDVNSLNRLKLLGTLLSVRLKHFPEHKASLMTMTAEILQKYDYQPGDTEGFVNYGLSLQDCTFTALASEKDGVVKISFRSKGDVDVNVIANEAFGGGGHKNAAGARTEKSLEEVEAIITNIIKTKL
jgi:phosphoesterase RecJ-like protein